MLETDERTYLQRRARQERERAERAASEPAGSAHRRLAEEYERRIEIMAD